MRALMLRRAGFAATLLTGLVLCVAGVSGLARVDTTLELAASSPPARPVVLVSHRAAPAWDRGECDGPRERV